MKLEVTKKQYMAISKLKQPGKFQDYKAILGERRAAQIANHSFHGGKVTIVIKKGKKQVAAR